MLKFLQKAILSVLLTVGWLLIATTFVLAVDSTKPIFFYGQGCPHCAKVESYLSSHNLTDQVIWKEVYHNQENAKEFNQIADQLQLPLNQRGVPFLYFPQTQTYLLGDQSIINYFQTQNLPSSKPVPSSSSFKLTLPLLLGAALADAINPCALAVLLILMATTIAQGHKRRALLSGLSFSFAIFLSYLAMGLGLYHAFNAFHFTQAFSYFIALIAFLLALFNLKDFFWYGRGFRMEVPLSWRPKLKSLLQSVTGPLGAFLIAFLISLFLLPCTSGPYLVVIGMLSQKTTASLALRYLILYNLVFISPMLLITFATYFGLNLKKAEEFRSRHLRLLHLITAIILFAFAIIIFNNLK